MSAPSNVRSLIAQVFAEMGGVGTLADVRQQVLALLPDDTRSHLVERGLTSSINGFFREKDANNLPTAPEVDEHGTHLLLELTSVEEYRYVVRKYMARSVANRSMALRVAERCMEQHGVMIDIDAEAVS